MNLDENAPQLSLAEWLRKAYSEAEAGCPPPEAFLEEEALALAPEERRRLDAHADRCPACAAERDLARLFAGEPEEAGVSREDLDFVVARLEAASPVRPAGQVVPFPSAATADRLVPRRAPSRWSRPSRKLAAGLILALGGGLLLRLATPTAPRLPAPQIAGPVRGGEIDTLSPAGEVAAIPSELLWTPRPWASSYRVRLSAVDDTVLWEATVPAPPARLPADVVSRLHRAVSYTWTVEALDGAGARMAASEPVRFRAKP
ncbi:MAG TPA: hypothetical protein VGG20_05190 [Thermoanaerobaculia bacterium]